MKKFLFIVLFTAIVFCQPFFYLPVDDYRRVELFILPQQANEYKFFLIQELQELSGTVYIAMYSFTDTDISSAVAKIIQNGGQVYLIIDPTQAGSTTIDEWLEQQGVFVKRKKSSTGFMHDKFMLIENSKTIWTGSANWTTSALAQDNNVLRLENFVELYKFYKDKFLQLWNK